MVLGEATDDDLTDGGAGLIAGTWETGGLRVAFDDFEAREPSAQAAATGNVLFSDDFSSTDSGWDRRSDEQVITDYSSGGYRIWVNDTNSDYWANPGRSFTDVRVEVQATKIGGPDDNDFGLICRYQNTDNFYFALVSSDGYAGIGKTSSGGQALLTGENLESADAILQGNITNSLRFDCQGNSLTLLVNGSRIATVTDSDFDEGDVGLIAGTYNTPGTDILFDDFKVLRP